MLEASRICMYVIMWLWPVQRNAGAQPHDHTWARRCRSKSALPAYVASRYSLSQAGRQGGQTAIPAKTSPAEKGESVQNKNGATALHWHSLL